MFGNICYYFETQKMNFTDAQTSCETKFGSSGGKLFEPKDLATHNAVREKQVKKVKNYNDYNSDFYETWIGISDRAHEGTFTFVSDDAHLPFTAWADGQPNDPGNKNEDCVQIYNIPVDKNYRNDQWADFPCSVTLFLICEQI